MRATEFITEEINPDILHPEFKHEQKIGDYTYTASNKKYHDWDYLIIKAYDGPTNNPENWMAEVKFLVRKKPDSGYLESMSTWVASTHRNKGIASTIYAYARMLGNTVNPSKDQTDMGKKMWKSWKKSGDAEHLMREATGNSTTLQQLYGGNYPDRDETFWDYVNQSEFDTPLEIQTLPRHKVMIMLLGQYRAEHIDDITDMLDDEQQEIVQAYINDPALSSKVIVLSGDRIIDGNHRALAAAIKGVPINYIDLADLDNSEELNEYESGTSNSKKIFAKLQSLGYKKLGSGQDATVWTKDAASVIKILMPAEDREIAEKGFLTFYESCKNNPQNPHLPKFIDIGGEHHTVFELDGVPYRQISMERLYPIPNGSFEEMMVWQLADLSADPSISWPEAVRKMLSHSGWYGAQRSPVSTSMPQLISYRFKKDPNAEEYYHNLFSTMQGLYLIGKENGLGWDLHTENVMQRQDGTLVIVDPYYT